MDKISTAKIISKQLFENLKYPKIDRGILRFISKNNNFFGKISIFNNNYNGKIKLGKISENIK